MAQSEAVASTASVVNQSLQNALALIIEKAVSGMDATVGFLSEQIPDVIQQLLMWQFAYHLIWGLVLTIGTIVFAVITIKWCRNLWRISDSRNDTGEAAVFATFFTLFSNAVGIKLFFDGFDDLLLALKIYIAPKIYLIEYAADLVKKMQ
jgi:hypothetical protein